MEGPSLVILKEEIGFLKRQKVVDAFGNAKIDYKRIIGKRVKNILSFGKHFLIEFNDLSIRIHFLMFGSYRLNETKDTAVRLCLKFEKDELNFYTCAVTILDDDLNDIYDWSSDVMSDEWDGKKARRKLRKEPDMNVADALLNQNIFAGVGNIIKNEVLYRTMVHPESTVGALPPRKLTALINEARNYSFDFYEWKKVYQLRKHWLVYKKKTCKRCDLPVLIAYTGSSPRLTFYCDGCQTLYK